MANKHISMILPDDFEFKLRLVAVLEGKSRSDVMREAIEAHLDRKEDLLFSSMQKLSTIQESDNAPVR